MGARTVVASEMQAMKSGGGKDPAVPLVALAAGAPLTIAGGIVLIVAPGGADVSPAPRAAFVARPGWIGVQGAF